MRLFLTVCFLLALRPAFPWSAPGHEMVADIAYSEMTTQSRAQADALLEHLPGLKEEQLQQMPPDLTPEDRRRYAFAKAAVWADMIKSNRAYARYNHPDWHYVNHPLLAADAPTTATTPADQPTTPAGYILHALHEQGRDLGLGSGLDETTRAVALGWLLHLVGDLHQPLHSITFVSARFPDGDLGGNRFHVRKEPNASMQRLHQVWDQMFGVRMSYAEMRQLADDLRTRSEYSRARFAEELKRPSPPEWSQEALGYARTSGYLLDTTAPLQGIGEPEGLANPQAVPVLPPGYLMQGREVSRRQVVLGGYRLADMLNRILDPDHAAAQNRN